VVIKDAAIKAKMNELGVHLGGSSYCCGARDSASYNAGHIARVLGVQCQAATQRCG